jgi:hypothetical protein
LEEARGRCHESARQQAVDDAEHPRPSCAGEDREQSADERAPRRGRGGDGGRQSTALGNLCNQRRHHQNEEGAGDQIAADGAKSLAAQRVKRRGCFRRAIGQLVKVYDQV